jgi:hypothetical protein
MRHRAICAVRTVALLFEVMGRPRENQKSISATNGAIVSRPQLG